MVRLIGLFCIVLSGLAVAKDPTQPVQRGSAEFSAGASYARLTGGFDSTGKYVKYPDGYDPTYYSVPLRIRWGLGNGFELRTDWTYLSTNQDLGSRAGFSQPIVGVRYLGQYAGVFTYVTLPFATGELDNGNLHTAVEIGGMFKYKSERFRVSSLASYINHFDVNEIFRMWARPEIIWVKGYSTFITGEYLTSLDENAWLAALGPGVRVEFSEAFAAEATTPFSVAGQNSPIAGWSISVKGLWTLKF